MNTTKVQFAVPCATLSITVAPFRAHVCLPGQASIVLYEGSESGFLLIEEVNRTQSSVDVRFGTLQAAQTPIQQNGHWCLSICDQIGY